MLRLNFWLIRRRPHRSVLPGARLIWLATKYRQEIAATPQDEHPDACSSLPTLRLPALRETRHITRILADDRRTRTMPTEQVEPLRRSLSSQE